MRKLSRIARLCRAKGCHIRFRGENFHKTATKQQNSQRFSPSKISRYTVLPTIHHLASIDYTLYVCIVVPTL